MIPLLILALVVALSYAAYRATRKWGSAFLCLLASGVCFVGASGVLAENLWGPQRSWNFAHHGSVYAVGALIQGIFYLALALRLIGSGWRIVG